MNLPDRVRAGRAITIVGVVILIVAWLGISQHSLVPSCTSTASAIGSGYAVVGIALVILAIIGIVVSSLGARDARAELGRVPATSSVSIVVCALLIPASLYVGFLGLVSFALCIQF